MEKKKNWNYIEAVETISYIRGSLIELRESIIRLKHLFRAADYNRELLEHDQEVIRIQAIGRKTFSEFDHFGIIAYDQSYRGIALYPFVVSYDDGIGKTSRDALYIYKDTRDSIDSYIFKDELEACNDLMGYEKPVPLAWRSRSLEPIINVKVAK